MNDANQPTEYGPNDVRSAVMVQDRWLIWPMVLVLVIFFCWILICRIPGALGFFLTLFGFLAVPIAVLGLLVSAGWLAVLGKTRRALSFLCAFLIPIMLLKPIVWATECVHVALTVGLGAGQIGSASRSDNDRLIIYDWSVGLAGGPSTFLVYDAMDDIALPLSQHKYKETDGGIGVDCAGRSDHLIGHYYHCSF